jgi:hypothetical protein
LLCPASEDKMGAFCLPYGWSGDNQKDGVCWQDSFRFREYPCAFDFKVSFPNQLFNIRHFHAIKFVAPPPTDLISYIVLMSYFPAIPDSISLLEHSCNLLLG